MRSSRGTPTASRASGSSTSGTAAARPGRSSVLDRHAARVVDPVQQHGRGMLGEVLVDSPPSALPMAVVVDEKHAAVCEAWIQVEQLVTGGLVPVGVEPQERYRLG